MKRLGIILLLITVLFSACRASAPTPQTQTPDTSAEEPVRAVWVSYLEMNTLFEGDAAAVKTAIAGCMETCRQRGVNTVYWHVRANSDAYYVSDLFEEAAVVRSLAQAGFDPLSCAVEEAHARGIALHAWVNPYRIGADEAMAKCEDRFAWEDCFYYVPTSDKVRALIVDGVRELIEGYAVDGVQFDDYFYPVGAVEEETPASFEKIDYDSYKAMGGTLGVADWRRIHVSRLVAAVYGICHTRENCVFGISPAYNLETDRCSLYADVAEWMGSGYVDYVCPQLYVGFQNETAPFETVLADWNALERAPSVSLIAGLALYKTGLTEDTYAGTGRFEWATGGSILARQVNMVRDLGWSGTALYANKSFTVAQGESRDAETVKKETDALLAAW